MPGINFSHQCRNNKEKWPQIREGHMQSAWWEHLVTGGSISGRSPPRRRPTPPELFLQDQGMLPICLQSAISPGHCSLSISHVQSRKVTDVFAWALWFFQWVLFPSNIATVPQEVRSQSNSHFTDASPSPQGASHTMWPSEWHFLLEPRSPHPPSYLVLALREEHTSNYNVFPVEKGDFFSDCFFKRFPG